MRVAVTKVIVVVVEAGKLVIKVAGMLLDLVSALLNPNNWDLVLAAFDGSVAAVISWFADNVDANYLAEARKEWAKLSPKKKAESIRNGAYKVLTLGD
jgi:hypothetical protein